MKKCHLCFSLALYMKYRRKGAIFRREKTHDLRCRSYNCLEFCEKEQGIHCDREIPELSGPDIDNIRFFFFEKFKFPVGKWSMVKKIMVFPGFFLGPFFDRSVPVNNYVMIVPDSVSSLSNRTLFSSSITV